MDGYILETIAKRRDGFDISKSTFDNEQDSVLLSRGMAVDPGGYRMYFAGQVGSRIYQYNLTNQWSIDVFPGTDSKRFVAAATMRNMYVHPNGIDLYACATNGFVYHYAFGTPGEVDTLTLQDSKDISAISFGQTLYGIFVSDDKNTLFTSTTPGGTTFVLRRYSMTSGDVSTASYVNGQGLDGVSQRIFFNKDRNKFLAIDNANPTSYIRQYSITGTDPTTIVNDNKDLDISARGNTFEAMYLANDDEKLFFMKVDTVYQYSTNL